MFSRKSKIHWSTLQQEESSLADTKFVEATESSGTRIETVAETKKYQMVYEKRVIDPETFMTYPYGYGEVDMEIATVEQDIRTLLDL